MVLILQQLDFQTVLLQGVKLLKIMITYHYKNESKSILLHLLSLKYNSRHRSTSSQVYNLIFHI